jgi:hypothetical protein
MGRLALDQVDKQSLKMSRHTADERVLRKQGPKMGKKVCKARIRSQLCILVGRERRKDSETDAKLTNDCMIPSICQMYARDRINVTF